MNVRSVTTTIALMTALCSPAFSQVRKYSNEFLSIGVGARGLAMGSAHVASVNDATAGFWNPSALTTIKHDVNLSIMHTEHFAGIAKLDYGAFAIPLKGRERFIGLSVLRFAVDDIPNTLELFEPDGSINYDNVKSFSVGDYAFLFSYAQKLPVKGLSVGGNVKIIYRLAGSFATAWGFGLDLSARYELKDFRFGFMAKDISGTFNAWSFSFTDREKEVLDLTGNIIPENSLEVTVPKFILAAAYEWNIKDKVTVLPELDFELTTDGKRNVPIRTNAISIDPRFGLEIGYKNIIAVRGGIGNIQRATDNGNGKYDPGETYTDENNNGQYDTDELFQDKGDKITLFQPSVGLGINIKSFSINYAFTVIGNLSQLNSHVISLNLGINKKKNNQ